jgi:hypothetical protein
MISSSYGPKLNSVQNVTTSERNVKVSARVELAAPLNVRDRGGLDSKGQSQS